MADIRIKDLTTTASTTAADDFFAADGATNGTRKLSAFSPTFGGNATVTGTLTTNGGVIIPAAGSISTLTSTNATHVANATWGALSQGYGTTADWSVFNKSQGTVMYVPTGTSNLFLYGKLDANTLSVYSTTASTTTSTGALVVGNGTSGGLGVGGAITLGSSLTSTASDGKIVISGSGNTTGTKELQFVRADGGDSTVLGLAGSAYAGVLTGLGNNDAYLYTSSAYAFRIFVGTSSRFDFTNSQFKINPTTASTSTSSGALVVSGGVGVAKELYVGSKLTVTNSNASALLADFSSAYAGGAASPYVVVGSASDSSTSGARIVVDTDYSNNFQAAMRLQTRNASGTLQTALTLDRDGNLIQKVNGTAPSLATNSSMTFELTSNTTLKIFVRGTDGTTRSVSLTLA